MKTKKITDKMRLDWLLKFVVPCEDGQIIIDPIPQFGIANIEAGRAAIDAAMRAASRKKVSK